MRRAGAFKNHMIVAQSDDQAAQKRREQNKRVLQDTCCSRSGI